MKLHHIGIAVDDIAHHAEQYRKALGISLTGEIIDDEIQKVRVAFAAVGPETFIEFVEPLGDDSPITRLLKKGGGLYHVCYLVPDVDSAIQRVQAAGGRVVSPPAPARAFGGRRIAWVYTVDRSLIEFLEQEGSLPGTDADRR
jgi:methylmalonyl-CoA/ethylmalonyl-CoA epimerase